MSGIQHRIWAVARRIVTPDVQSHEGAVRNASVASTALAQRRRETVEVEAFLSALERRRSA